MTPIRSFNAQSTASEVVAGLDLSHVSAIVTGASGGLGAETARALAERGARVTLTARDVAKGEGAAEKIRKSTGNPKVDVMALELMSLASVRAFAVEFAERNAHLNLLIDNAGVMACPLARTADGWESQFATNHIGHFLLTNLLVPLLVASAPSRVISVSSRGHRFSPVVFEDIHFARRPYDKWSAYGQSKTANVLFAVELDRRLAKRRVRANALHPGGIVTELGRHLTQDDIKEMMSRAPGGKMEWKTPEQGAATSVWGATAPELEGKGGLYLDDCQIASVRKSDADTTGYEAYARDPEAARRLWTVSEEHVGETFLA
ncbi:MAG TPA: SDR family NAD(P)-dependent oxidoreductase [Myxococcota bacterium]|nr:SDR family NAD(P)-dependent oxidoreductase [Myxococcota bacterium]